MGDRNQMSSCRPSRPARPRAARPAAALAFGHDDRDGAARLLQGRVSTNGLTAEMTPADHGGIIPVHLPGIGAGAPRRRHRLRQRHLHRRRGTGTMTGWVDNGSGLSAGRSRMFVYGTFDRRPRRRHRSGRPHGHPLRDLRHEHEQAGRRSSSSTSFISLDQAKKNHALELAARDFDAVRAAAKAAWNARLGVVSVKGANDTERTTLYSNLYRLNLYPNSQFENTGTAAAPRYQYASPLRPRAVRPRRRRRTPPSRTARSTSTTASGTPTAPCGRPTPALPGGRGRDRRRLRAAVPRRRLGRAVVARRATPTS